MKLSNYKFQDSLIATLKPTLNMLINKYDTKEIQSETIRVFLEQHDINENNINNVLIRDLLKYQNKSLNNHLKTLDINWTLKDLESLFYLRYNQQVIGENGIIFTPPYIADYINGKMIESAKYSSTFIDLSCGGGVFLLSATKTIKKKFPEKSIIEIIENNIYGIDILDENVYMTKVLLSLYALLHGEDVSNIKFNIMSNDVLELDVIKQFANSNINDGFDFVVGNPPYVKIQDLNKNQKEILRKKYISCGSGNYNLFYAFIELSFKIINKFGKVGYIIPNHLLKMKSAQNLRRLLIENRYITSIIDFKDNQIFENAQTYSSIILFDLKSKDGISYHVTTDKMTGPQIESYLKNLTFNYIEYKDIGIEAINLLSERDIRNIRKIESQPYSLKISTGIATQKDSLYMIDNNNQSIFDTDMYYYKEHLGSFYPIEKDITMQIIKGSGARRVDSVANLYDLNRIIYPYELSNGKITVINEKKMQEQYPMTYKYFIAIKDELNKRNGGNPSTKVWYEYGRAQALGSYVPKIIFPTNSSKPNFVYFDIHALFHNGYAIYGISEDSKNLDLNLLAKILNSEVMDYYIKLTSYMIGGGYYCYQKKYIQNFRIPELSQEELEFLSSTNCSEKINDFLINKYQLDL